MNKLYLLSLFLMLYTASYAAENSIIFSVLITEIMFDPNPSVGLPGQEYIELYNPSEDTVNLRNWWWQVGDKAIRLPGFLLLPGTCVLLLPKAAQGLFESPALILSKWLTLPNSGQYLVLKDPAGQLIHFASYSPACFEDALMRNGGYSLELQVLNKPCSAHSWMPTRQASGGSPGLVKEHLVETIDPAECMAVSSGYPVDNQLIIHFSDFLYPGTTQQEILLEMNDTLCGWEFYNDRTDQVVIYLYSEPPAGLISMKVSGHAVSCSGNSLSASSIRWGVPEPPDSANLLLSEILYEPEQDQEEYIEIVNNADRVIDVNHLIICTADENGVVKDFSDQGQSSHLLLPGQYAVFTPDRIGMLKNFPNAPSGSIQQRKDLPALSNSGGQILLLSRQHQIIDQAVFHSDMHDSRLRETRGVSLERLSFDHPGVWPDNWYSAASQTRAGTPGEANSQGLESAIFPEADFWLESETFCTGCQTLPRQAILHMQLEDKGFYGELEVRDLSGMLLKKVYDWGLLPLSGVLTWNGTDGTDQQLEEGVYVLLLNYIHPDGRKGRWKQAVALINY